VAYPRVKELLEYEGTYGTKGDRQGRAVARTR
jgi:hypothetical protein